MFAALPLDAVEAKLESVKQQVRGGDRLVGREAASKMVVTKAGQSAGVRAQHLTCYPPCRRLPWCAA